MSEAYKCDRCGSLREDKPHTSLQVGDGFGRSRPGELQERHPTYETREIPDVSDLCPSCMNDLRRWYSDGGGDPSDVNHEPGENDG